MTKGINLKKLRNDTHLTLGRLAELSGYNVATIVRLEQGEKVPPHIRESVVSILLSAREEGLALDVRIWRERALRAESKVEILLEMFKGAMNVLNNSKD